MTIFALERRDSLACAFVVCGFPVGTEERRATGWAGRLEPCFEISHVRGGLCELSVIGEQRHAERFGQR